MQLDREPLNIEPRACAVSCMEGSRCVRSSEDNGIWGDWCDLSAVRMALLERKIFETDHILHKSARRGASVSISSVIV